MRRVLSLIILAASTTGAFAADLSSPLPVKAVAEPAFSWTGFYIGGTAGYSFDNEHAFLTHGNDAHTEAAIVAGKHARSITNSSDGFTGGGEVGYTYQIANTGFLGSGGVVVGLEGDIQYIGPGSSTIYKAAGRSPIETYASQTSYLATLRARLGYAFDNLLVYGTGGWALGQVEDDRTILSPSGLVGLSSRSTDASGYAVGGGMAYAVPLGVPVGGVRMSAAVLKAEYLYYDLGTQDMHVAAPSPDHSFTSAISVSGNLVRVGIAFKFN